MAPIKGIESSRSLIDHNHFTDITTATNTIIMEERSFPLSFTLPPTLPPRYSNTRPEVEFTALSFLDGHPRLRCVVR